MREIEKHKKLQRGGEDDTLPYRVDCRNCRDSSYEKKIEPGALWLYAPYVILIAALATIIINPFIN